MQTVLQLLEVKFRQAFIAAGINSEAPIVLQEAAKPEFGDYQINGIMGVAKQLKVNPRDLATKVIAVLNLDGMIEAPVIAGPGFINIKLTNEFLLQKLNSALATIEIEPQTIVVDLSSPNLAKEMHVGHLRSTVIGDCLARINEYLGHKVIRQNHVGDWGTQFGMLTAYLREIGQTANLIELNDLEKFYRKAKQRFDEDEQFALRAREFVVKLQSGDKDVLVIWQSFVEVSLKHCQELYDKLKVNLTNDDICGESFYNQYLPAIIETLSQKQLLINSNGAKCVFFADGELAGGEQTPFIVQKSDGGYLYATTDLAAVEYRIHNLQANKILYVVDARQAFHFKQLFLVAKKAGFAKAQSELIHVPFGTMMGEDGKPFKTRSGDTVKLNDLIEESIERAYQMVNTRNPDWLEQDKRSLALNLGISAIKYADLSKNRLSDYVFSFDKMLAFDGNTAPYLLYAYTRINSIFKKNDDIIDFSQVTFDFKELEEFRLALHIVKFMDRVLQVSHENNPNYLCSYLYELASLFMRFYESCPILKAENQKIINSRLKLADMTAQVLKIGLSLLGIEVVEIM